MAQTTSIPIHDTTTNILSKDPNTGRFNVHEFAEGQTFFATDTRKFFKDKNGQRTIQIQFESIEAYDGTIEEFYERGTEGFEGEILVARAPDGFRMYYVDTEGKLNSLSYSPQEVVGIAQSGGLPEGFSNITLNFYKLSDRDDNQIQNITPPTVSGTINFETGAINITTLSSPWVESISDLDGSWTYDTANNKWLFNAAELPETLDPQKVKIVFSQIFLFSDSAIYQFEDRLGDVPSKWREDGTNQASLVLYRATSTNTVPTERPGDLIYDFNARTLTGNLNGWSQIAPTSSLTNRFTWAIATAVASNISIALIASASWDGAKVVANFSVDGGPGPTGPQGPTTVFKGDWSASATYQNQNGQRDIVYLPSAANYFILTGAATSTNQNPANGFPWTAFNFFQFIATEIALTQSSIVREDITVGDGQKIIISGKNTNNPYISIGQATIGYDQTGIYMDRNATVSRLSIRGAGGNLLRWTGSALDIVGDIGGTIGEIRVGNPGTSAGQSGVRLSSSGFEAFNNGTRTVNIDASGNASFTGTLNSGNGNIGGWVIGTSALTRTAVGSVLSLDSLGLTVDATTGSKARFGLGGFLLSNSSNQGATSFSYDNSNNVTNLFNFRPGQDLFIENRAPSSLSPAGDIVIATYSLGNNPNDNGGFGSDIDIKSRKDLFLRAGLGVTGGRIYLNVPAVLGSGNVLLRNPTGTGGGAAALEVSTRVVKKDIEELEINKLEDFISIVDIKKFTYKSDNSQGISLIIEDEQEENLPYAETLFSKIQGHTEYETWEQVPEWLREYKNTPTLTEENGKYYFNPKMYSPSVLSALTLAVVKEHQNKIKNLQEREVVLGYDSVKDFQDKVDEVKFLFNLNNQSIAAQKETILIELKEDINKNKSESEYIKNLLETMIEEQPIIPNHEEDIDKLKAEVNDLKVLVNSLQQSIQELVSIVIGANE